MKKQIAIRLMLISMGSALFGASALAFQNDDCPHAIATIEALRECVTHAREHGHIDNDVIAQSLLAKLDAAGGIQSGPVGCGDKHPRGIRGRD